jgi:ribosome-binding protein aMBF1 (putative translation factor)
MNQFGTLVRASREATNLSFAELSQAIVEKGGQRISRAQLCLLESGARICTLSLAYDIARGLEVDLQTMVSAAFQDRLAHAYKREVKALEEFIRGHRLGKKLEVSSITSGMEAGSLSEDSDHESRT